MNKYVIGAGILALLLIAASFGLSKIETKETTQVTSPISVVKGTHDFGEIDIFGGKVQATYILKNEGTENVSITSALTSCMCTEGQIGDLTFGMHGSSGEAVIIPAGEEKILTAIFDPLAHGPSGTGKIKRELILETDSIVTPDIKVTFSGDVVKNEVE